LRAFARKDAEQLLKELNIGPQQLETEASFLCTEWGIVVAPPDHDKPVLSRTIAEWVLRKGGKVKIFGVGEVAASGQLPRTNFLIQEISLDGNRLIDDTDMRKVRQLGSLEALAVTGSGVTDVGLQSIGQITTLNWLYLGYCRLTDVGLKHLVELRSLRGLSLAGTQVTDDGLSVLKGLRNLESLNLKATKVSDAGISSLAQLRNLNEVILTNTAVTEAGLQRLRKALPNCKIEK